MKKVYIILSFVFLFTSLYSQVKIGNNPLVINSSALLELESNNKGVLLPRLSSAEINNINSATKGLILFNTTDSCLYLKLDTGWTKIMQGENYWKLNAGNIYSQASGNVGIGTSVPSEKLHVTGNIKSDASIYLPTTTSVTTGVIYKDGYPFLHNAGNQAQQNVYLGKNAGSFNPIAKKNVAIGEGALGSSDGADNIAIGFFAANSLVGGSSFTDSYKNIYLGYLCGQLATGGYNNIAIGNEAGYQITTGAAGNVVIGSGAGRNLASGSGNCLIGNSVQSGAAGAFNTGMGANSGVSFTNGTYNTWMGTDALQQMLTGGYNTAIGSAAGRNDTTGNFNLYLGAFAGANRQGYSNIFIGAFAGSAELQGYHVGALIINNSGSTTHLINGDFNTGKVGIKKTLASLNYTLDVGGEIRTNPLTANPTGADGVFYYNSSSAKYIAYENGLWKDMIHDKVKSKSSDPTTTDIPNGNFNVWKNTSTGNIYLWVNDGGVLKKVQLQ